MKINLLKNFYYANKKNYLGRLKYNDTEIFLLYNKIVI